MMNQIKDIPSIENIIIFTILLYIYCHSIPYFDYLIDLISKINKIISNFIIDIGNFLIKFFVRLYFVLYLFAMIMIWVVYLDENIKKINNNKLDICINSDPLLCKK